MGGKNRKIIFLFIATVLAGGALVLFWPQISNKIEGPTACTQEAKLCPDGSYVGRTGPNCEFASCPDGHASEESGIKGSVLLGPVCPVMREPPDPECADKPYKTNLVLTTPDGAIVIATFTSDEEGKFKLEAAPGEYIIRSAAAANILPYCASFGIINVQKNEYADAVVQCDTGIR